MVIDPDLTLEELTLRVGGSGAPLLAEALPRALRHETLRQLCHRHDVPLDALVSELRRAVDCGPIELGVSALIVFGLFIMVINWYRKVPQGKAIIATGFRGTRVAFENGLMDLNAFFIFS